MLVPHIGGLEGVGLRLHLEDQIDDVLDRQVVGVRPPCQLPQHKWQRTRSSGMPASAWLTVSMRSRANLR